MLSTLITVALAASAVTVNANGAVTNTNAIVREKIAAHLKANNLPTDSVSGWDFVFKNHAVASKAAIATAAATVNNIRTTADDDVTAGSTGYATLTQTFDDLCDGGTSLGMVIEFGTCHVGETLTDASASQLVTYNGVTNGVFSFSDVVYSNADCTGSVVSTDSFAATVNTCSQGTTFKGVSSTYATTVNKMNQINYNTMSMCSGADYANVESAVYFPLNTCFYGYEFTCTDLNIYDNSACSGSPNESYGPIQDFGCLTDDDAYADDDDDDDDDDDFTMDAYFSYYCESAASAGLSASGFLAAASVAAAALFL